MLMRAMFVLQLGLEQILEIPNSLKQIAQSLEFVSIEKKTQLFEFFAAACLLLEDSTLIVEALDFFRAFQQDSFEIFKEELRDQLDLKIAYFMLINTLVVNTSEPAERRKIRKSYMPPDIYALFKEDEGDDDIREQLGIFEEEKLNDRGGAAALEAGESEDALEVLKPLLEHVRGT